MIERIVIAVLTNLLPALLAWVIAKREAEKKEATSEQAIDARVEVLKEVLKEVQDGQPVTPDQKEKFKNAIRNIVRGGRTPNGL